MVEDDILLAEAIIMKLSECKFQVEHCTTGRQALQGLSVSDFDLLILDLGLPDGFAGKVLQQIRARQHELPVLVLSAFNQVETKLQLLNDGADDYMIKPFDMRELEVRVRVLLRRNIVRTNDVLQHKAVRLDLVNHRCEYKSKAIALTRSELLLLKVFLQNKDRVLSRQHLEELVFGWDGNADSNAIEVHIHHLRKKIYPELIQTVRGFGYVLQGEI